MVSEYSRLPCKLKVDYFILYSIFVSTFVIFLLLFSMNKRRRTATAQNFAQVVHTHQTSTPHSWICIPSQWTPVLTAIYSLPLPSVHSSPKCGTKPICDSPLSRSARCSFAPLQKSRWKGHLHEDVILLLRPESFSFYLSYSIFGNLREVWTTKALICTRKQTPEGFWS